MAQRIARRNSWHRTKAGAWTCSIGDRGVRVRLFEKRRGGTFHRAVWIPGAGWLHTILGIPLEMKLLGANLIIVGVTVLLLFGPVSLQLARLTDAYVVVAALIVGATVNFGLVRLVLRPIKRKNRVMVKVRDRFPAPLVR